MRKGDVYLMEQSSAYPLTKCWCVVLRPSESGGWVGTLVSVHWSDDDIRQEFMIKQDHPGAVLEGRNVRNTKPKAP